MRVDFDSHITKEAAMGRDAIINVEFLREPEEIGVRRLRYELLRRFSGILKWKGGEDGRRLLPVLVPIAGVDRKVYDVELTCRYYGPNYRRGPALELCGLIIFLNRCDLVEAVYYGSDVVDPLEEYNAERALGLLMFWMDEGREGFADKGAPMCDWCGMPMTAVEWRVGQDWSGVWAWECAGCKAVSKRR